MGLTVWRRMGKLKVKEIATILGVNTYRGQLGLAKRLTYEAMGGKVLFSESYKYTNKRGKEKIATNYFNLPSFEK